MLSPLLNVNVSYFYIIMPLPSASYRVFPFIDPLLLTHFSDTVFWHTLPHSLCTEALFYETVSVIGFLASEYGIS